MIVTGTVRVPGDKSITHRALLCSAALARGTSHVGGALTSLDARSTARVLEASRRRDLTAAGGCGAGGAGAGAGLAPPGRTRLRQLGHHRAPAARSARRPPLQRHPDGRRVPSAASHATRDGAALAMGARFTEARARRSATHGARGRLGPLRYALPVSSAQIKSALLLAGLAGGVDVDLREPHGRSRDHTERMLRAFGYEVSEDDGWIGFRPGGRIRPVRDPGAG